MTALEASLPPSSVTVLVPTWLRAEWLGRCLDALDEQSLRPNEVLVVGRPSDTSARQVFDQAVENLTLGLRWFDIDRPGHIAPIQLGLSSTTSDVLAILDDDAEPEPSWLRNLVQPFSDTNVAVVGGRVLTSHDAENVVHRDAGQIRWYGRHIGNVGSRTDSDIVDVATVMEGNSAWRTSVLRQIPFDEILDVGHAPLYGLDLCLHARELGYRVRYVSNARVYHHEAPRDPLLSRDNVRQNVLLYARNSTYILLKHLSPLRRIVFLAWSFAIGERSNYGVATLALDLGCRRYPDRAHLASFPGKMLGIRLWLQRRAPSGARVA